MIQVKSVEPVVVNFYQMVITHGVKTVMMITPSVNMGRRTPTMTTIEKVAEALRLILPLARAAYVDAPPETGNYKGAKKTRNEWIRKADHALQALKSEKDEFVRVRRSPLLTLIVGSLIFNSVETMQDHQIQKLVDKKLAYLTGEEVSDE